MVECVVSADVENDASNPFASFFPPSRGFSFFRCSFLSGVRGGRQEGRGVEEAEGRQAHPAPKPTRSDPSSMTVRFVSGGTQCTFGCPLRVPGQHAQLASVSSMKLPAVHGRIR